MAGSTRRIDGVKLSTAEGRRTAEERDKPSADDDGRPGRLRGRSAGQAASGGRIDEAYCRRWTVV